MRSKPSKPSAKRTSSDDEDEPPEWEDFKSALPREGFVPLAEVVAKLRSEPLRWTETKALQLFEVLKAERELIVRSDDLIGLNNALNRAKGN